MFQLRKVLKQVVERQQSQGIIDEHCTKFEVRFIEALSPDWVVSCIEMLKVRQDQVLFHIQLLPAPIAGLQTFEGSVMHHQSPSLERR